MADIAPPGATSAEIERYYALKNRGSTGPVRPHTASDEALANPRDLAPETVLWRETIMGGGQVSRILRAGQSLRLVNTAGRSSPALIALNADLPSERLNTGDTAKIQWNAFLGKGKLLYSDMGRVFFSITEDTCGFHDLITGASTAATIKARFRGEIYRSNARDNFILALGKFGLGPREVVPCVNFFTAISVEKGGRLRWQDDIAKPGDFIDLRAEMNVLVALSNTSHPLASQDEEAPPIEAIVWKGPEPGPDDLCRTSCEEAMRAFVNTRDFLIQSGAI